MSDQQNSGFGKFVPGFDFLQNLSKGTSQAPAAMPNLSNWVAPTLNLEELDKRISELKAVHFWLDQNSKALGATIQALELQKMTLATLKGMNFNMADIANALKLKPTGAAAGADKRGGATATTGGVADAANQALARARGSKKSGQPDKPATGVVDPMQWWGALTQQFQEIAAGAMKEAAKHPAVDAARDIAAAASVAASVAATAASGRATVSPKSASGSKAAAARRPASKSARRSR